MATNPTKILTYDLDPELGKIISSLTQFRGAYASLYDRLMDLGTDTFTDEIKEVIDDLINGYQDGGVLTIQQIKNLEKALKELKEHVDNLDITLDSLEMGNFNETFAYDTSGNVTTHSVTGDRNFTVTYNYKPDGSGELTTSVKEFTKANGDAVTITQTYTYTNGDITGISTATTVVPAPEPTA